MDEFCQVKVENDELIDETDVVADTQVGRKLLQARTIRFTELFDQMRMCCAEDDVEHIRERPDDGGHRVDHVFDALVR